MPDKPPQQPYKFCEAHFVAKCPICSPGQAQPNPSNELVATSSVTKPPDSGGFVQQNIVTQPALTDPTAQKVVQAAQNYARAIETVKIISEQLKDARELVAALEKQLKGNQDLANAAQEELRNATAPRAVQNVSEKKKTKTSGTDEIRSNS